jgi:hypothetical protein
MAGGVTRGSHIAARYSFVRGLISTFGAGQNHLRQQAVAMLRVIPPDTLNRSKLQSATGGAQDLSKPWVEDFRKLLGQVRFAAVHSIYA